jgi:hypothetical protein
VFRNPSFRALFFGMLFSTLVLSIEGVFSPYMGVHFWGFTTEQLAFVPLVAMLGLLMLRRRDAGGDPAASTRRAR